MLCATKIGYTNFKFFKRHADAEMYQNRFNYQKFFLVASVCEKVIFKIKSMT